MLAGFAVQAGLAFFRGQGACEAGLGAPFNSGYTLARGTYSVDGDSYIEETNNGNCPAPMSYKYSFDGTNLKFELTDQSKNDSCEQRKMGFDGVTYVLSK